MMNEEQEIKMLTFYDEDGKLKSKDEIIDEFLEVYNEIASEESKPLYEQESFMFQISDPENTIEIDSTLETYHTWDRQIFLTDEISPDYAHIIFSLIEFWNKCDNVDNIPPEERLPIKIFIDTPGGDINATFTIIDTIQSSITPVYTYTIGAGYSGGFFIGICGHKRYGLPNTSYMFHEGFTMYGGDAHKFHQYGDFYKRQLERLKKITIEHTSITAERYEEIKKDDLWLDADAAKDCNIIDEIITTLP